MLLEEFDEDPALINPADVVKQQPIAAVGMPKTVLCPFSGALVASLLGAGQLKQIGALSSINGPEPVYQYETGGSRFALFMPRIGAANAVGLLEELYGAGARQFVVFGSCGVLDPHLAADTLIIPTAAIRDEGTSYHYAPASPTIAADPAAVATMQAVFDRSHFSHQQAVTWTTDAFYRETAARKRRMIDLGAQVVEMEAAALFAWSQFRQLGLYQFFYTADHVAETGWDERISQRTHAVADFFAAAVAVAQAVRR
ncbi:nucleoside phosphorylase [Lacticaseibacillus jixianensis]|uniref:Uridine phosphorylase n=1 Tax=Lacticaseibacillus jixianensis TaxID=2486012 RepID=A0ABW4B7F3_9LACO|nr:nucleoside phosphorylase [Lacticaseibacillus jixianensis]